VASFQAVTKVNAEVAPKVMSPEAEPATEGSMDGRKLTESFASSGGVVATAW
jgi:hypothetical protein